MSFLVDTLSKGLGKLTYPLFLILLVGSLFFFQVSTNETYKISTEYWIGTASWVFILAVAASRALAGRPLFSGASGSWARRILWAFALLSLVSAMLGYNPGSSFGYWTEVVTYLVLGQSVIDWLEDQPARRNLVLGGLGFMVVFQAVLGILQWNKLPNRDWSNNILPSLVDGKFSPFVTWIRELVIVYGTPAGLASVSGTLGNVNYLGELLSLIVPAVVCWAWGTGRRALRGAGILLGIVAFVVMLATGSRAVFFGFLLSGLLSLLMMFGWQQLALVKTLWTTPGRKLGTVLVGIVALAILIVFGGHFLDKMSDIADSSLTGRLINWQAALLMFRDHPLLGNGIGTFKLLNTTKLHEICPMGLPPHVGEVRFLQAHSEPLQMLAEQGLIGLLLLLGTAFFWFRETARNPELSLPLRFGLVWGMGALLLASTFAFPFHVPLTSLMLVLIVALGLARSTPQEARVQAPSLRFAYGALALIVVSGAGFECVMKGVYPLFMANRFEYVAGKIRASGKAHDANVVYQLASRYERFKGTTRWYELQSLVIDNRNHEALDLFASSPRDGMSADAVYWQGRAYQALGQPAPALLAFQSIVQYYNVQDDMAQRAQSQIRAINQSLARMVGNSGQLVMPATTTVSTTNQQLLPTTTTASTTR